MARNRKALASMAALMLSIIAVPVGMTSFDTGITKATYIIVPPFITVNDPTWDPTNPLGGPVVAGLILCDLEGTINAIAGMVVIPVGTVAGVLNPAKAGAGEVTGLGGACDLDCDDNGGNAAWCQITCADATGTCLFSVGFDGDKDGFSDNCPSALVKGSAKDEKKRTNVGWIEKEQCPTFKLDLENGVVTTHYLVSVFVSVGTTGQISVIDP